MLILILGLTSCGEKAGSQEVSIGSGENSPQISQISKQFSEVSPPSVIQELRSTLEAYQPQVTIITPKPDEVFQDNKIAASFQVKDLPIFKDPQWELGPHLHVILDNQPYIPVYDLNQPLVLSDLSPGTHTLRVFASRPWHESFKNEGAYTQATFHIFTKTDDNNPSPELPLLTYSRPQRNYGAEPILLDFYLTNAPLHLVAKENANNEFSDWRIRCTINGESFIFDRWQAIYLKGFKPGQNWVKLEFLDNQGNAVKNAFNTTVRLTSYQPKGKDTLSRIVRGELTANEVRRIVDPNYTVKVPATKPTPAIEKIPQIQPKLEKQPIPETEVPEKPKKEPTKPKQLEQPELQLPTATPSPSLPPTLPEVIESPTPESQPEVTPTPESTPLPEKIAPQPAKSRFGGFFNRRANKPTTPSAPVMPSPVPPTLPEVIESPAPDAIAPSPESRTEVTPTPESTPLPEKIAPQPAKSRFGGFFNRRANKIPTPSAPVMPSPVPPTLPEIIESPAPDAIAPSPESRTDVTPTPVLTP